MTPVGHRCLVIERLVDRKGRRKYVKDNIDFKEKRGRKELWKWRWVAGEENFYILDEWLSIKERENRFHLVKTARELEEKNIEKGKKIKVKLENNWIKIGEERYKWNRKEEDLKKISEKEADEESVIESWKEAMLCEIRIREERTKQEKEKEEKKKQELEREEKEMKESVQKKLESTQKERKEESSKEKEESECQ
ncbi:hypothetical protein TSAR_014554 [Trichomalopsis sarcophagae]|uniref:Uncharacterized protein n=1 Tax=Trichomalopsis sarcophagae TaxID=543379 RepID=A0A232F7W5_9HYME|nr:hypothetical protein TSAR_014554 [Trichomalopsis sarcophagae]